MTAFAFHDLPARHPVAHPNRWPNVASSRRAWHSLWLHYRPDRNFWKCSQHGAWPRRKQNLNNRNVRAQHLDRYSKDGTTHRNSIRISKWTYGIGMPPHWDDGDPSESHLCHKCEHSSAIYHSMYANRSHSHWWICRPYWRRVQKAYLNLWPIVRQKRFYPMQLDPRQRLPTGINGYFE